MIPDTTPIGASFPLTAKTESTPAPGLTNVTADFTVGSSTLGFYFVAEEGEKFVTDAVIFAGHVLVSSFIPDPLSLGCGPGKAFFYAFKISDAQGHFTTGSPTVLESRRKEVGAGVAAI